MDSTFTIQTKKQKLVSEGLSDFAKEDCLPQKIDCQPADQPPCNVNDEDKREDLNGAGERAGDEQHSPAPQTPPKTKNGDGSPVAAEQNSSGFGDEIGPDDDIKSSDSSSDEENATPNIFPPIFQTDNLTLDERLQAYSNIFLAKSEYGYGSFDIHQEMYWFLTETVLETCWTGIWKVDDNCDVVVEVNFKDIGLCIIIDYLT